MSIAVLSEVLPVSGEKTYLAGATDSQNPNALQQLTVESADVFPRLREMKVPSNPICNLSVEQLHVLNGYLEEAQRKGYIGPLE